MLAIKVWLYRQMVYLDKIVSIWENKAQNSLIFWLYNRKRSLLIYRIHKIMITTSALKSIHRMLQMPRKEASAHRISAERNVDEICQKMKIIKSIFSANPWPSRQKTKKTQFDSIRREKRYKRQISRQRRRSKEGRRHPQTRTLTLRERERERERRTLKPRITHIDFPLRFGGSN